MDRRPHIHDAVPSVVPRPTVVGPLPVLEPAFRIDEEEERVPAVEEGVEGDAEGGESSLVSSAFGRSSLVSSMVTSLGGRDMIAKMARGEYCRLKGA